MTEVLQSLHGMVQGLILRLPYVVVGLVVFAAFYLAAKGTRYLITRITERRRRHRNLGIVLGRLAQGGMIFIGLLVALVIVLPTFSPGELVQLLGISSVAIGFAFRDILQNFMAGILLLLTEPFRIDDQIRFGDFEGTVENIQTRATIIRTYDGRRIVIPNANLFTNAVTVNTAFEHRRLEYDVGIGYGDDVERAKALILEAVRQVPGVLPEPAPDVLVASLALSTVNLRVRWWVQPPRRADALDAQDQVLLAVRNTLVANGIDLPFDTRTVLFHDQTEETDGDRSRQREGWPAGKGEVPRPRTIAEGLYRVAERLARDGPKRDATNRGEEGRVRKRRGDEEPGG